MNKSPFLTQTRFGSKTTTHTTTQTPITSTSPSTSTTSKKIATPPYITLGAHFYHATSSSHASTILSKGIDPTIKGNVNALGRGFYTVHDLKQAWQWLHPDLDDRQTDEKRKEYLSENYAVVVIEVVQVPTKIFDGPSEEAEVVVGEGDIVWTKNGIGLVKVVGRIDGESMRSDRGFQTWYEKWWKLKK